MIPENVIDQAAAWIANQQRDPFEDKIKVAWAVRYPHYLRQAKEKLMKLATSDHDRIGMAVYCGGRDECGLRFAIVRVEPDAVFGFLPEDVRPSFIWPDDLSVKLHQRWDDISAQHLLHVASGIDDL